MTLFITVQQRPMPPFRNGSSRVAYNPDEWRLFIHSSKRNLKCVLLHNGNKFVCIPVGHSVIVKEYYLNVKTVLHKLRYSECN